MNTDPKRVEGDDEHHQNRRQQQPVGQALLLFGQFAEAGGRLLVGRLVDLDFGCCHEQSLRSEKLTIRN
jgi:hypothetical protein